VWHVNHLLHSIGLGIVDTAVYLLISVGTSLLPITYQRCIFWVFHSDFQLLCHRIIEGINNDSGLGLRVCEQNRFIILASCGVFLLG
jgi:hypothetical protein